MCLDRQLTVDSLFAFQERDNTRSATIRSKDSIWETGKKDKSILFFWDPILSLKNIILFLIGNIWLDRSVRQVSESSSKGLIFKGDLPSTF